MKYLVYMLFIFLPSIQAQSISSYGFKIGITNSTEHWVYTESTLKNEYITGFNLSSFIEFNLTTYTLLLFEIGYNQKGMKDKVVYTDIEGNVDSYFYRKNRLDYLDFVLVPKFNLELENINPYMAIGPRLNYLIAKHNHKEYEVVYKKIEDISYGLKFIFGVEFEFFEDYKPLIEFQYNHDLSKIYETNLLEIKNRSFEFKLGVAL